MLAFCALLVARRATVAASLGTRPRSSGARTSGTGEFDTKAMMSYYRIANAPGSEYMPREMI
jgi:hypothetical protein